MEPHGDVDRKRTLVGGAVLLLAVVAIIFYYFLRTPVPEPNSESAEIGQDISSAAQAPVPETNPFRTETNPFKEYKNPFE